VKKIGTSERLTKESVLSKAGPKGVQDVALGGKRARKNKQKRNPTSRDDVLKTWAKKPKD